MKTFHTILDAAVFPVVSVLHGEAAVPGYITGKLLQCLLCLACTCTVLPFWLDGHHGRRSATLQPSTTILILLIYGAHFLLFWTEEIHDTSSRVV